MSRIKSMTEDGGGGDSKLRPAFPELRRLQLLESTTRCSIRTCEVQCPRPWENRNKTNEKWLPDERLFREIVKVSEPPSHPLIQKLQRAFPPSRLEMPNQNCGGALDRNRYPDTYFWQTVLLCYARRVVLLFSPEFSWVTGTFGHLRFDEVC